MYRIKKENTPLAERRERKSESVGHLDNVPVGARPFYVQKYTEMLHWLERYPNDVECWFFCSPGRGRRWLWLLYGVVVDLRRTS